MTLIVPEGFIRRSIKSSLKSIEHIARGTNLFMEQFQVYELLSMLSKRQLNGRDSEVQSSRLFSFGSRRSWLAPISITLSNFLATWGSHATWRSGHVSCSER